jgi:hypothetical protein
MATLETNNTLTNGSAKLGNMPAGSATKQQTRPAPTAKKPRHPSKPVSSGSSQRVENNAKLSGGETEKGERHEPVPNKSKASDSTKTTKAEQVLKKLRLVKGATIETLIEATGWQAHSVRGFLSAVVKKKLGLNLVSEIGKDGLRRYRIDDSSKGE